MILCSLSLSRFLEILLFFLSPKKHNLESVFLLIFCNRITDKLKNYSVFGILQIQKKRKVMIFFIFAFEDDVEIKGKKVNNNTK